MAHPRRWQVQWRHFPDRNNVAPQIVIHTRRCSRRWQGMTTTSRPGLMGANSSRGRSHIRDGDSSGSSPAAAAASTGRAPSPTALNGEQPESGSCQACGGGGGASLGGQTAAPSPYNTLQSGGGSRRKHRPTTLSGERPGNGGRQAVAVAEERASAARQPPRSPTHSAIRRQLSQA